MLDQYLTAKKVRSHLGGIAHSTLYAWIKSGKFPAPAKVGSLNLWSAAEVQKFMDAKAGRTTAKSDHPQ